MMNDDDPLGRVALGAVHHQQLSITLVWWPARHAPGRLTRAARVTFQLDAGEGRVEAMQMVARH